MSKSKLVKAVSYFISSLQLETHIARTLASYKYIILPFKIYRTTSSQFVFLKNPHQMSYSVINRLLLSTNLSVAPFYPICPYHLLLILFSDILSIKCLLKVQAYVTSPLSPGSHSHSGV